MTRQYSSLLTLIVVALAFICSQVSADDLLVPSEYPTIQAAIDAAAHGDRVLVAPGIYVEAIDLRGKQILVEGTSGYTETTISAAGLDTSVITCSSGETEETIIRGFTITGGQGRPHRIWGTAGGGAYLSGSAASFESCRFALNHVTDTGGGAFVYAGTGIFRDCIFHSNGAQLPPRQNQSLSNGGGASVREAHGVFERCEFIANDSDIWGGGLSVSYGSAEVRDSLFHENVVHNYNVIYASNTHGAGMSVSRSAVTIEDCEFLFNLARRGNDYAYGIGAGLSIINDDQPALVRRVLFADNVGEDGTGGSLYLHAIGGEVEDCDFTAGEANYGGAASFGGNCQVRRCNFYDNTALYGGAIHSSATLSLIDCTISENEAVYDGGGIYTRYGTIEGERTQITANRCSRSGGAVYHDDILARYTNCSFVDNTASIDGGASYQRSGEVVAINSAFIGNESGARGGAIAADGGELLLLNLLCIQNTNQGGSGDVLEANGSTQLTNCIIWNGHSWLSHDSVGVTVTYSDIQGGHEGVGNIDAHPRFQDEPTRDYRLRPGSPCRDLGDNWAAFPFGDTDLAGNPRFNHSFIDMGPYEFQSSSSEFVLRAPIPARANVLNTFDAGGATPTGNVALVWAMSTGLTPIPQCPGVELGLQDPTLVTLQPSDPYGFVRFSVTAPARIAGRTIYFQAVDAESCTVSNVIEQLFDE